MRHSEKPISTPTMNYAGDQDGEMITHPAFGVIKLSKVTSSGRHIMFGSDTGHRDFIRIDLETAANKRSHHRDRIDSREHITSLYMTHAQWARFISSAGDGSGTPVTLRSYRNADGQMQVLPEIERSETMRETHSREIEEIAQRYAKESESLLRSIEELLASGKANKTQLKELRDVAYQLAVNMPKNMAFVQSSLEENMELTLEESKCDIEGFILGRIVDAGLGALLGHAPTLEIDSEAQDE